MKAIFIDIGLLLAVMATVGAIKTYVSSKWPPKKPLGRVLPKLCLVDADEILTYKEKAEEEWQVNPHLRRVVRRKLVSISSKYYSLMRSNAFRFQQVVRFDESKIDRGKPSVEYDTREVLITNLVDESARLRLELFQAQADLVRRALFGGVVDLEKLQTLLGKYKGLEHEMVELANMAKDKTCRDMLIERLGLVRWKIIPGGGPEAEPA